MATETLPRDFSDKRVFVVGVNNPHTHQLHELDYLGCEQTYDGPRYIVVGPDASNEKIMRNLPDLIARYGVTLPQLQAVRDSQLDAMK